MSESEHQDPKNGDEKSAVLPHWVSAICWLTIAVWLVGWTMRLPERSLPKALDFTNPSPMGLLAFAAILVLLLSRYPIKTVAKVAVTLFAVLAGVFLLVMGGQRLDQNSERAAQLMPLDAGQVLTITFAGKGNQNASILQIEPRPRFLPDTIDLRFRFYRKDVLFAEHFFASVSGGRNLSFGPDGRAELDLTPFRMETIDVRIEVTSDNGGEIQKLRNGSGVGWLMLGERTEKNRLKLKPVYVEHWEVKNN